MDKSRRFDQALQAALSEQRAGNLDAAVSAYERLLGQQPRHPDVLHMLGLARFQQGDGEAALRLFDQAMEKAKHPAAILSNMASVHLKQGDFEAAVGSASAATRQDPRFFNAWMNLGLGLTGLAKHPRAARAFLTAHGLAPGDAHAYLEALYALMRAGEAARAERHARGIGQIAGLATREALCIEVARYAEHIGLKAVADRIFHGALAEPDCSVAMRLAWIQILTDRGRIAAGLEQLNDLYEAGNRGRDVLLLRSLAYQQLGEPTRAIAGYRELLEHHADWPEAHSNLLIALQYDAHSPAETIYEEHLNWARAHLQNQKPAEAGRTPGKALRIAWVSTGFRKSPVAIFFKDVSSHLPRDGMKHLFYHDSRKRDELTDYFKHVCDEWRETATQSHKEFADQIRADGIDVVVEMTGHGPGNRLQALDLRPAPLQLSWLDYFHSTGAVCMDAFIADQYLVPERLRSNFVERVAYLERGRLCYSIPDQAPDVGQADTGPLVLGCFNRLAKLNDDVLSLWSELMAELPDAQLYLRAQAFSDEQTRQRFLKRALTSGLPGERMRIGGAGSYGEILASYGSVAVALDPFPFSGCATSCDALWMGVPVVTLCGDTMASRQSAALLNRIGLDELIAHTQAEYANKVIALARDAQSRRRLKRELRSRVEARLCDAQGFARELCGAIRRLWEGSSAV